MLITQIKPKDEILRRVDGNVLIVKCTGCREVHFPEGDIEDFIDEIGKNQKIPSISVDYLCNEEYTRVRIEKYRDDIDSCRTILVFSCGVGMQVFTSFTDRPRRTIPERKEIDIKQTTDQKIEGVLRAKKVVAGLDTVYLRGFQGLTPSDYDCARCGDCVMDSTGGICPVVTCSKSLLNGPCGGAKQGKCEIDAGKECGWHLIYERLKSLNKLEGMRNFRKDRDHSLGIKAK